MTTITLEQRLYLSLQATPCRCHLTGGQLCVRCRGMREYENRNPKDPMIRASNYEQAVRLVLMGLEVVDDFMMSNHAKTYALQDYARLNNFLTQAQAFKAKYS
jgi:hypothetical protein